MSKKIILGALVATLATFAGTLSASADECGRPQAVAPRWEAPRVDPGYRRFDNRVAPVYRYGRQGYFNRIAFGRRFERRHAWR